MARPARRFAPRAALAIVLVAAAVGAYGWRLARMPPAWWSPALADDATTAALAEQVEYRLAEEATKVRPTAEPWWLRIREPQVNAWLAARLPAWVAHAWGTPWPEQLGAPQVHFSAGAISVGIDLPSGGRHRYLSASLKPAFRDGALTLTVANVSLGRLRIPGGSARTLADRLAGDLPPGLLDDPAAGRLLAILAEGRPLDPVVELADGRRLRLLDVRLSDGEMVVQCAPAP